MTGRASDEARVAAAAAAAVGDGGDCFVIPRKATRLFAYDWVRAPAGRAIAVASHHLARSLASLASPARWLAAG